MAWVVGAQATATDIQTLAREVGGDGAAHGAFSYTLGLGILLNRLARHLLIRQGAYERALTASRAAQALFEALGATSNAAQCRVDQAVIYQAVGEHAAALGLYEAALDRYTAEIVARPRIADIMRYRVIVLAITVYHLYLQRTAPDGMERSAARLREQLAAMPSTTAGGLLPGVLATVTAIVAGAGEPGGAGATGRADGIPWWSLRQLATSIVGQAGVLAPLYRARRASDAGNEVEARAWFDRALAGLTEVSMEERGFLEATIHAEQREYALAAAAFQRHLAAGGANAGFMGVLTSVMARFGGDLGQAEARLQERRTHDQAFTFLVRIRAYADALRHVRALERLAEADGRPWWSNDPWPWRSLSDCGKLWTGLGDLPAALAAFEQAIDLLEARRGQLTQDELKTALASDKGAQYLYFLAARAALLLAEAEAGRPDHAEQAIERAFAFAERGRARALLDLMAATGGDTQRGGSPLVRAWRQGNAQLALRRGLLAQAHAQPQPEPERIASLTEDIAAAEVALRQIEAELARADPTMYAAIGQHAPTWSLAEVRAALPPDTVMLVYAFLGDDLLAWAIAPNQPAQVHRVAVEARRLTRTIQAFHRACADRAASAVLAATLADVLVRPFEGLLDAWNRLIIVPYGAAHRLPFQALPHRGQPLGATHAIAYLPSASALQFLRRDEAMPPATSVLAIGNPTGDLPFAATEAAFVASLFEQQALIGGAATEAAVLARVADASLLHFATHGRLSETAPLTSSLALADGAELTVYELIGLRLTAQLVVLSACDTGRGETTGGDEVIGLTRGLLAAGARAAVVSLWPVDDISTSLLMGRFYQRLRLGDPPDLALQAAQHFLRRLTLAEVAQAVAKLDATLGATSDATRFVGPARSRQGAVGYDHPYHWAPFILVG
jgi:CHAT domain-containing protein